MDQPDYSSRFHQALAKAFAARSPEVRAAYFDLASFYHEKLAVPAELYPSADDFRSWMLR